MHIAGKWALLCQVLFVLLVLLLFISSCLIDLKLMVYQMLLISKMTMQFAVEKGKSVASLQWEVVKNPAVWILGLSSLCCYIARYAIESWGIIYLTEAKGYTTMGASGVLGVMQFAGIFGALTCGLVSDKFFNHRRNVPALIYGVLYALSIALFVWAPASYWVDMGSMMLYGFTMGALVCYLGGLMAVDISLNVLLARQWV